MALYAFFRLVWRPAFALLLPMTVGFFLMLFVMSLNWDLERSRQLDLSMLAIPLMLGMLVGQTVHDVRCRFFSWTLPNFNRKLATSVMGIALLSALAWSLAYRNLGGEMDAIAGFAGFLLVFMAFAAVQPNGIVAWLSMLAAAVLAVPLFNLIRAQPIAWTVVALMVAAACYRAGFGRGSSRRTLLSPHALMGVNLFNRLEVTRAQEEILKRSDRSREWHSSVLGRDLRNWVRAIEHGSLGVVSRVRTGITTGASFAFMGLCITSPAFMHEGRTFDSGLEHAFHVLFTPPIPLENPTLVPVSLMMAIWAAAHVFSASGAFQRGWVYPLSRDQRSRVAYRLGLRQNLLILTLLSLTFVAYGGLIVLLGGGGDGFGYMPGYFRGVIAIGVLLPLVQRYRLWLDQASNQDWSIQWTTVLMALGVAVFAGLAELVTFLWSRAFSDVATPMQAALLVALLMASQGLFRRALANHHRLADLI